MRLFLALPAFIFLLAAADGPRSDAEIDSHLESMRAPGQGYANVEPAEGRYLRDLVKKHNVRTPDLNEFEMTPVYRPA
jgi:hypothetical protein